MLIVCGYYVKLHLKPKNNINKQYTLFLMVEYVDIAGGVIINQKKEVLLVYNHETDSWSYPKGHVKEGEDFLSTAKREIKEETNITELDLVCKLPVYERPTRQKKDTIKVMRMFLFKTKEEGTKSNTNDIADIKWIPIDEVTGYFSYREEVDFFERIKDTIL